MQTTPRPAGIFVVLALIGLSLGFGDPGLPRGHAGRGGNSAVLACLSRDNGLRVSRTPVIGLPVQLWFRPAAVAAEPFHYELLSTPVIERGIPLALWTLR